MYDKTHSCRLMPKEREYLNKYYSSFSDYVHDSFKRDIELSKNNRKKNKLQKYSTSFIMLCIGSFFLLTVNNISNLLSAIVFLLLGVFFTANGAVNFYYDFKEKK